MKNSSNYIQATHKPSCILDYLSYHNKNILYVDADTLFTSKFHHNLFKDIDIAITPRHQKALSDIFSDQINLLEAKYIQKWNSLNILLLEAEMYNDVACKTGKLLHFKNAGRNEKALKKYQFYAKIQSLFPNIFQSAISLNRKYKFFI